MPKADVYKAGLGIWQKPGNRNQLLLEPTSPARVKCYCEITLTEKVKLFLPHLVVDPLFPTIDKNVAGRVSIPGS